MYYIYEKSVTMLVIKDNLNEVETQKCEACETLEDIPFDAYDYYDLPDSISNEQVKYRTRK